MMGFTFIEAILTIEIDHAVAVRVGLAEERIDRFRRPFSGHTQLGHYGCHLFARDEAVTVLHKGRFGPPITPPSVPTLSKTPKRAFNCVSLGMFVCGAVM
ncbi:unnamed protein product [Sphagnum balticum]